MAFTPIRDQVAVGNAALNLLIRDTMLAGTVWRDPVSPTDFARKKDETISLYLPAYLTANKRALRANAARVNSHPRERKVDVTLSHDLQVDIPLTDENQTLDVRSLVTSVVAPAIGAIVRAYDEEIAAVMTGATYQTSIAWDTSDPYKSLVDARIALDDAAVPATGRYLVIGTQLAAQLLKDNLLVQVNTSGSAQTLRNGVIGTVAGFDVLTSAFLPADVGFAYHMTAFALASRAPVVPDGVAWGVTQASDGFSIRVMQHLSQDDNKDLLNIVYHDSWFGCSVVKDNGTFNVDGKFIPSVDPSDAGNDRFVRAVKIGGSASS